MKISITQTVISLRFHFQCLILLYISIIVGFSTTIEAQANCVRQIAQNWNGGINSFSNRQWIQISSGDNFEYGILRDSTVWGQGALFSSDKWRSISNHSSRTMGIKTNGTLWGWGENINGQLGDGTKFNRDKPAQVGVDKWLMVSSGSSHTLAIKENGTLWTWGKGNEGQLGDGGNKDRPTPLQIGTDKWLMVSGGLDFSLGIKSDGTLWAWGQNYHGQLGLGFITDSLNINRPVQVGTDKWRFVGAAVWHTVAIKNDGTLWSWGSNNVKQLGFDDLIDRYTPTKLDASANWKQVAGGDFYSVALKNDGTLWACGEINGKQPFARIGNESNWTQLNLTPSGPFQTWARVALKCEPCSFTITGDSIVPVGKDIVLKGSSLAGSITWTSSDPTIATVSSTGVVKAIKAGSLKITYAVKDADCSSSTTKTIVVIDASQCSSFPQPAVTITIRSTIQSAGASIANVPIGATSSITAVATELPNVLRNTYRAKMQLGGCTSEKLFRYSQDRNRVDNTDFDRCIRIINVATGKVLEVVNNSQAERAPIRQATDNGGINQTWQTVADLPFACCFATSGYISRSSGKLMTLSDFSCSDTTTLVQESNKSLTSQRFVNFTNGRLNVIVNGCAKSLKADLNSNKVLIGVDDSTDVYKWRIETVANCPAVPNCTDLAPIQGANTVCVGKTIKLTGPNVIEKAAWGISDGSTGSKIFSDGTVAAGSRQGTETVFFTVIEGQCLISVSKTITVQDCTDAQFDSTKCYRIVNNVTKKVLEVKDASQANGALIQLWSPIADRKQQFWQIVPLGNGRISIVSRFSNKLIDADDCTLNAAIKQFTTDGTNSQKWELLFQSTGTISGYTFKNETCGTSIGLENGNTADGTKLILRNLESPLDPFIWTIEEAPCINDVNKCFQIVNKATNKVLEVKDASTAENAQIYQWASATNRPQQIWQIKDLGNGQFNFISKNNGKLIDAPDCTEGGLIKQFALDGTNSQKWKLELQTDGFYKILNATCNKYMRVESSSTLDGANVGIKNDFGSESFKWSFREIGCSNSNALSVSENFIFDAKAIENRTQLRWITKNMNDIDYFNIERLNEKGSFEALDKLNAHKTEGLQSYAFTDNTPLEGDNYYRIQTISNTAHPQYSEVKKVRFIKTNDVGIFPNPASEYIDLDLRKYEGKAVTISLYNSMGTNIKTMKINKAISAPQRIDLQEFNMGSYMLRIQAEGKRDVLMHVMIAE
jgi:hypothetical protein